MTDVLNTNTTLLKKELLKKQFNKDPFKFDDNLKEMVKNDNDLNNEECSICMARGVNNAIKCTTCGKKICTICCNFMKNVKYDRDLKNIDNCGVMASYKCPYCNCDDIDIPFSKLNKDDILQFVKLDYIIFIEIGNAYNKVKLEKEGLLMKSLKVEHVKKSDDDNVLIDYLIEENMKLKKVAEIVPEIFEQTKNMAEKYRIECIKNEDNESNIKKLKDECKGVVDENNRLRTYCENIVKYNKELQECNNVLSTNLEDALNCNNEMLNSHKGVFDIVNNKILKPHQKVKKIIDKYKTLTLQKIEGDLKTENREITY